MAIRRLLSPEATVSQTASYCLTAGLWCRAQTLSPTPRRTPPPPPFPPLCFSSLLVLRAIIFIWKPIQGYREKRDKRKRLRGEERHTERQSGAGEENCDSSEAVIDATSVCLHCTLPAKKRRALLICSYISIKKKSGFSTPTFSSVLLRITSLSAHKDQTAKRQA